VKDHDSVICYQSRATPQQWIGPSTEAEIERAARDMVAVLVVPIAFVSDHSETLVELDVDYRALAGRLGVPGYFRVPVPNSDPSFITALARLVRSARSQGAGLCNHAGGRICPTDRSQCPYGGEP
jgi:ferrochelatase